MKMVNKENLIDSAGENAKYDVQVKRLISNKPVLDKILKECTSEFEDVGEENIGWSSHTDETFSEGERPGNVNIGCDADGETDYYDVKFDAYVPTTQETIKVVVKVDTQDYRKPELKDEIASIPQKAIQCCMQAIADQKDPTFAGDLEKVYCIWICPFVQGELKDTITQYSLTKKNRAGDTHGKEPNLSILNAVVVGLSGDGISDDELVGTLDTIFSEKLTAEEKLSLMTDKFNVKMTDNLKADVYNL